MYYNIYIYLCRVFLGEWAHKAIQAYLATRWVLHVKHLIAGGYEKYLSVSALAIKSLLI